MKLVKDSEQFVVMVNDGYGIEVSTFDTEDEAEAFFRQWLEDAFAQLHETTDDWGHTLDQCVNDGTALVHETAIDINVCNHYKADERSKS